MFDWENFDEKFKNKLWGFLNDLEEQANEELEDDYQYSGFDYWTSGAERNCFFFGLWRYTENNIHDVVYYRLIDLDDNGDLIYEEDFDYYYHQN